MHIERALLTVNAEFIEGSGLEKLIGQINLSATGMKNTAVSVSDIKRCRYGLQLSAGAIYEQLCKAFSNSKREVIWEALER